MVNCDIFLLLPEKVEDAFILISRVPHAHE